MTSYQGITIEKKGDESDPTPPAPPFPLKLLNLNTPPLLAQNICCRVGKSKDLELLRTFNLCKKFSMDIIVYR